MTIRTLIIFCFFPTIFFGQKCDCPKLSEETFQKIQSAYAGFDEKANTKIKKKAVKILRNSAKIILEYDCAKSIFEYISLFNERHMLFSYADSIINKGNSLIDVNKSDNLFGEWTNRDKTYTIKFKYNKQGSYFGTVTKSSNSSFQIGQTIIEVFLKNKKKFVAFSEEGKTYFTTLKEENNSLTLDLIEKYNRVNSFSTFNDISTKTDLEIQNDSIAILRLPRFSQKSSKKIKLLSDSIYLNNNLKYLILDVRGNPGGDPDVFYALRKLYYSKPISFPDISFKISKEIRQLDSLNENPLFEEYKHFRNKEFYNVKVDTFFLKERPKQFKKIFVLTDRFTGSTAEVFIKELSQSNNVIHLGETTNGVVDYFRVTPFKLKNEKFNIQIPLGKINWDSKIDFTGIKPSIDLTNIDTNWTEYVIKMLIPKYVSH